MTPEPPSPLKDCIYHNTAVRKAVVEGLEKTVKEMEQKRFNGEKTVGRPPRLGNVEQELLPRRFYVEVSVSDLKAIVIPAELKPMLVKKLKLKKHKIKPNQAVSQPRITVPIRWIKCCEYFVQVQWFDDELIIFKGWEDFAKHMKLDVSDVLVFKYEDEGFDLKVFWCMSSTQ